MKKILKHFLNQRGISLIEILIGSLISLIIAAAVMGFYITQHNQWLTQEKISDMQQNGRAVMEELTRQVRSAGFGMSAAPFYRINGDTLIVYRKPGADVDTIRFYISRSDTLHPNLMKKVDTQSAQLFAENITQITFTQLGTGALQVSFTAREARKDEDYASNNGYRTRQLTTRIKLRNV
jgi:Tfp pilus assembly protein PilV